MSWHFEKVLPNEIDDTHRFFESFFHNPRTTGKMTEGNVIDLPDESTITVPLNQPLEPGDQIEVKQFVSLTATVNSQRQRIESINNNCNCNKVTSIF